MPNDSSTGGPLLPVAPSPAPFDIALEDVLQPLVAGVTGLPGNMVRPRWQAVVPKQPEPGTDWAALGVTLLTPMGYPAEWHDGADGGSDTQEAWEEVTFLASFYGPNGMNNASLLRRGLYVPQNREALQLAGLDVVDAGSITPAPDFVNNNWIRRYDLSIRLRRKVQTTYPVLNLASADAVVATDTH